MYDIFLLGENLLLMGREDYLRSTGIPDITGMQEYLYEM